VQQTGKQAPSPAEIAVVKGALAPGIDKGITKQLVTCANAGRRCRLVFDKIDARTRGWSRWLFPQNGRSLVSRTKSLQNNQVL
jgi:hypothetical protein